jgi:hypothetical protein
VEQLKSRNSKAFPFRLKTNLEFMRIKDAPMDDSLGSDPEETASGKKKGKKEKQLKNLAMESDV